MADENSNIGQEMGSKITPDQIKKLESDLKAAFKENRFVDVKKLAEQIKTADPENHLAGKLLEKVENIKAEQIKKANAEKIKAFEFQIKEAFKNGKLMDIAKIAGEIKKIDPENKTVKKIEARIDKAKASLDAQVKKEKIKAGEYILSDLVKSEKWDDAVKKANDLLALDEKNSYAMKVLGKASKAKKVDTSTLITAVPEKIEDSQVKPAVPPVVTEKKQGFFTRLFTKNPEDKPKAETKAAEIASKEGMKTISMTVKPDPAKAVSAEMPEKTAPLNVDADKKAEKDRLKSLEEELKLAIKGKNESAAISAIEEIRKLEPENKAAKKAYETLNEEKAKLEKAAKKEKIKGLTGEIKGFIKNEEWDKAVAKANDLLIADPGNGDALSAIKKADKAKNAEHKDLTAVSAQSGSENDGFFSRLFRKKEKNIQQEPVQPVTPMAKPVSSAIKPVTPMAKPVSSAIKPVTPMAKPVSPAVQPVTPIAKPASFAAAPVQEMPVKKQDVSVTASPAVPPNAEEKKDVTPDLLNSPKPSMIKPVVPAKPPVTVFKPEKVVAVATAPVSPVPVARPHEPEKAATGNAAKPSVEQDEKGNIFTKLFGQKSESDKPSGSIIETIVAQSEEEKRVQKKVVKKTDETGDGFLRFANLFMKFSAVFIVISFVFFYAVNIDENNRVLALAGRENNALQLKNASAEMENKKEQESKLNRDIERFKKGYENEHRNTIDKIVQNRMDWPDLIKKLNEVTESVYEKNALAQYVQYNNYAYDVKTGRLTVSATLSDPLGKNLTKLAEIEEAFMYYPKDKNDPNDIRKPYFYNLQDFRSYTKTFNRATGRYVSNFSLSLSTKDDIKK